MTFAVFCTFDLKNASSTDYQNAYSDLETLGLKKVQANDQGGNTVIPTTSVLGGWTGTSAVAIRNDVRAKIQALFKTRGFKSEIFAVVGGEDWTWGSTTT